MTSSSRLNLISNQIPTLKTVAHPKRSHGDSVRNSNRTELITCQIRSLEGGFDSSTERENMLVAPDLA